MNSAPIPRLVRRTRSVSAELAAHLERLIVNGELAPGARLPPERELAAEMSVSRASLRQAMFELESKNLIERRQGRGSTIVAASAGATTLRTELAAVDIAIANAIELRDIVEPRIAGFAAQRVAESNLLQLDQVLAQSNENLSAAESFRLDKEFHQLLAHASQNPLLVTLCEMTTDWTEETRGLSHATRTGRRISIEGHISIYEAVGRRDADAASAAMEKHLLDVRNIIAAGPTT
ncbi:FCD domain-containing protein [Glaciihabitans sp. UYNi722]|uniref:FadR/GntR family transcriptional regulator n=1 Tax=Glaciihabitans sp. UYNi722 TaxID=3156344 RepID=UPI0033968D27